MRSCKADSPSNAGRGRKWFACGAGVLVASLLAGALGWFWVETRIAKTDPAALVGEIDVSKVVLDRHGELLRAFQTPDDRWRLPVRLDEVDRRFIDMLLAFEDQRYFVHDGVDLGALARASVQALTNGRIISGASTLTMQVVRLLREAPTRDLGDKLTQIFGAYALERQLSKDEILNAYLLRAPYGGNLEGVRAASLAWFGKEPARLTPAQAALLVALPQSPEARRPDRFPGRAKIARDRVLDQMARLGVLDKEAAQAAKRDPIPRRRRDVPIVAPHVSLAAVAAAPDQNIVRTTLDRSLQKGLEALAAGHAAAISQQASVAILVVDHRTGEVLARVGSPGLLDEARLGYVDMTRALRSPGSLLKPFIYGLAFEDGIARPESLIDDRRETIEGYSPTNFDQSFQGTVTVREALQLSLNVPAVKVLAAVGAPKLLSRIRAAGARPRFPKGEAPGLAVGLGGLGLTLWDLVRLYASLAEGGMSVDIIESDVAREGEGSGGDDHRRRVLASVANWYVGDILLGTPAPKNASGEGIAYKTGTSYGYRDAWAIGYDGAHVVGVWVGRANGTPIAGITGHQTAAPILFEAFQQVDVRRTPLWRRPAGALSQTTSELPGPMRRVRLARRLRRSAKDWNAPEIFYPPNDALVELEREDDATLSPLVVKIRRGKPPYSWFVNGAPVVGEARRKSLFWTPNEVGPATIVVVDSSGRTDRIRVDLR